MIKIVNFSYQNILSNQYLIFINNAIEIKKHLKKKNYVEHQIKIIEQNENIAKENQKVFYDKTIFNLKNNNQIELKKFDEHKNNEIKEIESKYNKLKSQLDSIKMKKN